MRKERKHFTPEEKVATLRRHLVDKVPVSELCEELGLRPTVFYRWHCSSVFCADYLRPAAKAAGVLIPDGHRWGLHNLRHSLSNWLVNKAKENPKTV
jgi:integrase